MAKFRVPQYSSMPVISGGRIQGIRIQYCLVLSVILSHLTYFSFSMVSSFRFFFPVTYPDVQLSVMSGYSVEVVGGVAPL